MTTFNEFLSNIFDKLEIELDNEWGQFVDIEEQPITTFRELSVDKIFRKKNQPPQIDILGSIKEDKEELEQEKTGDIETTKGYKNNVDMYNSYPKPIVIYLQYYVVTGLCGVIFIKLLLTI
jgi:hypothetical protein